MKIVEEFKKFAMKGNMVDLAVGVILGAAFGAVVTSLVENILMPPLGYAIGGVDFSELTIPLKEPGTAEQVAEAEQALAAAKAGDGDPVAAEARLKALRQGVAIRYGMFINALIRFLIQAVAVFLVIKAMNRLTEKKDAEAEKPGPVQEPQLSTSERLLTEIRDAVKHGEARGVTDNPDRPAGA